MSAGLHLSGAVVDAARPHHDRLDEYLCAPRRAGQPPRLLSVARIPDRPRAVQPCAESRSGAARADGPAGVFPHAGGHRGGRARRGAGQWRPGPARSLFHGQLCDARSAGDGVWPALPVRHVSPAHRERLPGRGTGQLAARRHPLGGGTLGVHPPRAFRRADRTLSRRNRGGARALGGYPGRAGSALRHADHRLPESCGEHAAAVEGDSHRRIRPQRIQRR